MSNNSAAILIVEAAKKPRYDNSFNRRKREKRNIAPVASNVRLYVQRPFSVSVFKAIPAATE